MVSSYIFINSFLKFPLVIRKNDDNSIRPQTSRRFISLKWYAFFNDMIDPGTRISIAGVCLGPVYRYCSFLTNVYKNIFVRTTT